jgi:hypothetical protein
MNYITCVETIIHAEMSFIITTYTELQTFKDKNKHCDIGLTLKYRSNAITFPDSLGMTSYTLAILFFALKPIVNKLLSIEIVIFHTFTL